MSLILIILKFNHAHFKIYGRPIWPQASKHTHACAQCNPASVGLAQPRPNYCLYCPCSPLELQGERYHCALPLPENLHSFLLLDIWSAGCVFVELLLGQPIFLGDSVVDQLVEILKVLGTPTKEQI